MPLEISDIAPEFEFLAAKGLQVVQSRSFDNAGGFAEMELRGAGLAIKLERDRGARNVYVLGGADEWVFLQHALEYTTPGTFPEYGKIDYTLSEQAAALQKEWQRVVWNTTGEASELFLKFAKSRQEKFAQECVARWKSGRSDV